MSSEIGLIVMPMRISAMVTARFRIIVTGNSRCCEAC